MANYLFHSNYIRKVCLVCFKDGARPIDKLILLLVFPYFWRSFNRNNNNNNKTVTKAIIPATTIGLPGLVVIASINRSDSTYFGQKIIIFSYWNDFGIFGNSPSWAISTTLLELKFISRNSLTVADYWFYCKCDIAISIVSSCISRPICYRYHEVLYDYQVVDNFRYIRTHWPRLF